MCVVTFLSMRTSASLWTALRVALQREEGTLHRLVGHAAYVPSSSSTTSVALSAPAQRNSDAEELSTPAVLTRTGKIALWWTWLLRGVQLADARVMPTALSPSATLAINGSSDRCVCVCVCVWVCVWVCVVCVCVCVEMCGVVLCTTVVSLHLLFFHPCLSVCVLIS
jgi:hypothetical protein